VRLRGIGLCRIAGGYIIAHIMMILSSASPPRPPLRLTGRRRLLTDALETGLLIGIIFVLVNLACGRFVVDGISIAPNLATGQFILVSRVHYLLAPPQRGDIIVFRYPNNPTDDYIKRVIGLPGETVELRDQQVFIGGEPLDEAYINEPCHPARCPDETWTVGLGQVFVMGDNRNHSIDSRVFGAVDERFIIGEALLRYFPFQDIGSVVRIRAAYDP